MRPIEPALTGLLALGLATVAPAMTVAQEPGMQPIFQAASLSKPVFA